MTKMNNTNQCESMLNSSEGTAKDHQWNESIIDHTLLYLN